jgi:XapX domain-containing protein
MKTVLGLSVGFLLGFACRYFDIPVPSPPKLLGAFLVVAVTFGYMAADHVLTPKNQKATIVQTLNSESHETVSR